MQFENYFGNDHFLVSKKWTKNIAAYRQNEIVVKNLSMAIVFY